jgi:hypothetical protein
VIIDVALEEFLTSVRSALLDGKGLDAKDKILLFLNKDEDHKTESEITVDDIAQKIANIPQEFFDRGGGVFTLEVPNIGYDLVDAPGKILKMYSDAKRVKVEKEERGKPVMVTGYIVDALIDDFVTDKLSVVLRPTREVKYLPEDLQEDPVVTRAVENGKLMSVLSSWPGKETPPASQWGDTYAVIIPTGD